MRIRTEFAATTLATVGAFADTGVAVADADAHGIAAHSPGFLSGNLIQVPIHIPVNVCGNSVNLIGLANPAGGTTCVNKH
ncbi:chaplin [Streptomyces sp. NPDC059991]|uniref:chaplin n=1 Tax=Streptomyces sp. NPDC059991 TaxID=3347028 RepID=UPI00367B6890